MNELWTTIPVAFLGGLLPTLVWLWFWQREDRARPEPSVLVATAFIAGMIAVPLVLPLQRWAAEHFASQSLALIFAWAMAEEILKYGVAVTAVLWRKAVNEPVDFIVYMITVALGFAALENTLFLINPLTNGTLVESVLTGDLRFLGATLLHTLSSATIGVALALAYYKKFWVKRLYGLIGVILAISLHTLFNFFIIRTNGEYTLIVFSFVWLGIICLILAFEFIKKMGRSPIRS